MDPETAFLLSFGAGLVMGLALRAERRRLQRWRRWQYDPVSESDEIQTALRCLDLASAPGCTEVRRLLLDSERQRLNLVDHLVAQIRRSMEACEAALDEREPPLRPQL